jgi:hypothetical protein
MATLRRGLVDTVKKAAAKVGTRGAQVAAKAGTRGARVLVETTAAAVKTVDKLQAKLGRRPRKSPSVTQEPMVAERTPRTAAKPRRTTPPRPHEAQPVELREAGRKTMAAPAPKRSKQAKPAGKQFKVKRGQKHLHSGR